MSKEGSSVGNLPNDLYLQNEELDGCCLCKWVSIVCKEIENVSGECGGKEVR